MSLFSPPNTPEDALARFQTAYAQQDIEAIIELTDYDGMARRALSEQNPAPSQEEIKSLAEKRANEYRSLRQARGFGGGLNIARSQVVREQVNSPEHHAFVVEDRPAPNAVNVFVMHFRLTERGWLYAGS